MENILSKILSVYDADTSRRSDLTHSLLLAIRLEAGINERKNFKWMFNTTKALSDYSFRNAEMAQTGLASNLDCE